MKGQPDIVATVRLFPTEEGGRTGPTPAEGFACPLEFEGQKFDCRLLLDQAGPLSPGTTARVPIAFLIAENIKPRLKVRSRFTLWEMRTIGEGTVEEIVPD